MSDLEKLIRAMAGFNELNSRQYIFPATVDAVDGRTCTVIPVGMPDDAKLENVRLSADINGSAGLVVTPVEGSVVLVGRISAADHVVLVCSEIEKVELISGDATLEMADGEITMNGGGNGGLVIVAELVSKLNALEEKVNELLQTLQGVVIQLAPSGTYPLATDFAAVMPIQPVTQPADIENDKVKH